MLDVSKMCIMTSKFIILHFKGTIMFKHFSDERMAKWQRVSVTVSNFNAYLYNRLFLLANLCCVQFD